MVYIINSVLICLFILELEIATGNNTYLLFRNKRYNGNDGITCELPQHPRNGKWTVLNGQNEPGDRISKDSIVKFECFPDYKLSSCCSFLPCDENWSLSKVPTCEKKCSAKYSSSTTFIKCEDKFGREVPCDEAVDGTYLSYSCAPFYETPFGYKKTILCVEGTWNFPNPVCQPVCGKKIDNETIPLIIGGEIEKRVYPWVMALYKKTGNEFQNSCGGSLLSQRIVITAAHCVTNEYGNALPTDKYMVGAGTYYTKYKDPRGKNAQYTEVSRFVVQKGYKAASQRFLADIALVITKDLIIISEVVQPVCYQNLPNIYLQAGKIGVVAGWGKTETGRQPDELRTLEIPYKHQSTCSQELPSEWADKFNTNDKLCVGFFNQNRSVCTGDSGSGLFFVNPEDNRYYIHGVVSVAPAEKGMCNIQQNSLYTSVAYYYDFVDREATKQYVEQCSLPSYPKNGKWIVPNQNKKPGDIVPSTVVLKVECNEGYTPSTKSPFHTCEEAYVLPYCILLCPKLIFPTGTISNCTNAKGEGIDCSNAVHGTRLTYFCDNGYRLAPGAKQTAFCNQGSWGNFRPECLAEVTVNKDSVTSDKKVVCTYASWYTYNKVLPEDLNVTLCTHIIYSFIGLSESGKLRALSEHLELDSSKKGFYRRFTDLKKKNKDLKVLLSIGSTSGTDATRFSDISKNQVAKSVFISSVVDIVGSYDFDGANIEWFYPQSYDKVNYINLLKDLREKCNEKGWLLTAHLRSYPDDSGYDGTEMDKLLDFVILRTYDFYGPWSPYTGQNAGLYPSSVESVWERSHLNIDASANNWLRAGISKSKIILSIPFYGRTFKLKDKNKRELHSDFIGAGRGDGVLRYSEFCTTKNWITIWDDEQKSSCSYIEDEWVGHENNISVRIKAAYVKDKEFLGVNVWPIDGDDVYGKCGPKQILLKYVHLGLGNNISINE